MDGKNKKYLIIGIVIIVVAITVISASCVSAGLFDDFVEILFFYFD